MCFDKKHDGVLLRAFIDNDLTFTDISLQMLLQKHKGLEIYMLKTSYILVC